MEAKGATHEKNITLKEMERHFTKTLIGALALALVSAFLSSYAFYFRTNNSIDELNVFKTDTKADVKELKKTVNDINDKLSSTGFYTNANQEEIKTLKQDIKDIKTSQADMLKLLYDINLKSH